MEDDWKNIKADIFTGVTLKKSSSTWQLIVYLIIRQTIAYIYETFINTFIGNKIWQKQKLISVLGHFGCLYPLFSIDGASGCFCHLFGDRNIH